MEEKTVYIVQFWTRPDGGERVIDWLNNTHLADVVSQPGFLWTRMFAMEETDEDGWPGYMMMYGVESRESLETYFNSEATQRYAKEREELGLDELLRIKKFVGTPGVFLKSE